MERSPAVWKPSRYNFWATVEPGRHLLFNGATGALYELSGQERLEVEVALMDARPPPDALGGQLVAGGMLVRADRDEPGELLAAASDSGALSLTVVPTLDCNCRCRYCYVDFRPGAMSRETADAVVRLAARRLPGRTSLLLHWFGGEPLLAPGTVAEVTRRIGALVEAAGVSFEGLVATNGVLLTPQVAAALLESGIRYFHVTLDGPARYHDRLRPLRAGGATFDLILENVLELLATARDARLTLRLNADPSNVAHLEEVLGRIPPEARDRVTVNPTEILWRDGTSVRALRAPLNRVVRRALTMGFRYQDNALPIGRGGHCHGDDPHHLQIGPDGTISSCSPSADKPEVTLGTLAPDGRVEPGPGFQPWWSAPPLGPNCRDCEFLCFCRGGCRVHRLRGQPTAGCRDRFADMEGLVVARYEAAVRAADR